MRTGDHLAVRRGLLPFGQNRGGLPPHKHNSAHSSFAFLRNSRSCSSRVLRTGSFSNSLSPDPSRSIFKALISTVMALTFFLASSVALPSLAFASCFSRDAIRSLRFCAIISLIPFSCSARAFALRSASAFRAASTFSFASLSFAEVAESLSARQI